MLKETFSTADDDTASQLLVAHINDFIPLKLYMFPVFSVLQFFSHVPVSSNGHGPLTAGVSRRY